MNGVKTQWKVSGIYKCRSASFYNRKKEEVKSKKNERPRARKKDSTKKNASLISLCLC